MCGFIFVGSIVLDADTCSNIVENGCQGGEGVLIIAISILAGVAFLLWKSDKKRHCLKILHNKLLIKMSKLDIFESFSRLNTDGDVDSIIDLYNSLKDTPKFTALSEEKKQKINIFYSESVNKKVQENIKRVEELIKNKDLGLATKELGIIGEMIHAYPANQKSDIESIIYKLKKRIEATNVEIVSSNIRTTIDKGELDKALSMFDKSVQDISVDKLSEIDNYLKCAIKNKINKLLDSSLIDEAFSLLKSVQSIPIYENRHIWVEDYFHIIQKIVGTINEKTNLFDFVEATEILNRYQKELPDKTVQELKGKIEDERNKYEFNKLIKAFKEKVSEIQINNAETIISEANEIIKKAELCKHNDKAIVEGKKNYLKELQNKVNKEKKYRKNVPHIIIPVFNVPKPGREGEDATPICIVEKDRTWGVIGVFDGMGGAGARKYKHKETGEEHTSAYWGSKIVSESVEKLIRRRVWGEDPFEYIENNLHRTIVNELNKAIENFPSESATLSKMIRKLPTTMALCAYNVGIDGNIEIRCYWAGDSRVYLFDKNRVSFLTIDDADAPDGDPVSPANMDLAMNNAISQDRNFRINKSVFKVEIDEKNPILIVVCTDGCFGYFKNPIEFEYMLRTKIASSKDEKEYSEKIVEAIINNIQQDDFSMTAVSIGTDDFANVKNGIGNNKDCDLFKRYNAWKGDYDQKVKTIASKIAEEEKNIFDIRSQIEAYTKSSSITSDDYSSFKNLVIEMKKVVKKIDRNNKIDYFEEYYSELFNKQQDEVKQQVKEKEISMSEHQSIYDKLKIEADAIQIDSDVQNNDLYKEYKSTITTVKSIETI